MIAGFWLLLLLVFATAISARMVSDHRRRKALADAIAGDRVLTLMPSSTNVIAVSARVEDRVLDLRARAVDRTTWFLTASLPRVGQRCALLLERQTAGQHLKEMVGVHDVRTHDSQVDRLVRIRGGDADMTRGLVCVPEVLAAIRRFFVEQNGARIELAASGEIHVAVDRGANVDDIRAVVRDVVALLEILDEHADASARPDHPALVGGVGPDSGTPFGVPLGERR